MDTPEATASLARGLGPIGRARASVAALRVLHTLESEQRTATDEERHTLQGWSGWGPLAKALDPEPANTWKELAGELQELLTPSQLQQGLEACFNSFYTPEEVTSSCWDILTGLGFDGGRILEPGCGSGHFISATPENVDAAWVGVEADEVSAAIARHLHPQAMVLNKPMEEANLPEHSADAVIGNVPFGDVEVYDPTAPQEVRRTLHDYMIWSSVRTLAPGGLAVLVTSCGTLDKSNATARQAIDAEAVLVGAIRLPNGALASLGTNTAADILILRRRTGEEAWRDPSGRPPKELPEDPLLAANAEGLWVNTGESMNPWLERFSDDMVLGTVGRSVYRTGITEVTAHEDEPWTQGLRRAVEATVERAQTAGLTSQTLAAPVSLDQVLSEREDGLKEGQILTVDRPVTTRGKTRTMPVQARVTGGVVEEVRTKPDKDQDQGNLKPASKELLALIELRDAAVALFEADADLEGVSDAELPPMRERTLELYQAYTDTYGPIGRSTLKHKTEVDEEGNERLRETITTPDLGGMRQDVDLSTLLALEHFDLASNTAEPADILHRRINAPTDTAVVADSPHDAVALSLNEYNRIEEPYVASLLGVSEADVSEVLIGARAAFRDPQQPQGDLVPAATYLSGAVGHKLEQAQAAAEEDAAFEINTQALLEARPEPLPPEKITARLGAQWIPPEVIREFAREVLKIDCKVSTSRATGEWDVKVDSEAKDTKRSVTNCEMWAYTPPQPRKGEVPLDLVGYSGSGPLRRGDELLAAALNNKPPTIKYHVSDEKTRKHDRFSRGASTAQERLQRQFSTWVWQDPTRASSIAQAFNRDFQSTVPNEPDGSRLTFPGMSSVIEPYQHQLDFVAMSLSRPSAAALHDMGGGKTATMFMTAVKHVQLGLATNPIIVVPNGLREDITRAGKQLFPSARILMATDEDLKGPEARRRFALKCAANRWDAIVMTEPMYSKLPVHEKSEAEFHDRHKATLMATLEAETAGKSGAQSKKIAKKLKARTARTKELLKQTNADDNITYFEHLGSTMVLYDEASDWMRNLGEFVKVEGVPMSSPYNASQGYLKAQTLQMRGGKAMLFTGTPMVRGLMDLYSIILSTNEKGLHARGIYNAEQFARTFARFEDVLEPTADGQDVKVRRRIREPLNRDQLLALVGESCHMRMHLGLKVPDLEQHIHTVEATPEQRMHAQELAYRETQIRGWQSQKGEDTYLSLVAEGRASALDPVLAGMEVGEPSPKLNAIAENVAHRYHQTKDHVFPNDPPGVKGSLQVVFMNQGVPHGTDPRSYGRLRAQLVEQGVPAERIRLVHDYEAGPQRARLYDDCRSGKVSVLIGSFNKMGYGVNIQDRLSDIHIADVAWNPADLRQAIKRGHRPGNFHDRMNLYYYPVKGTVDARFFALNEQRRRVEEAFFSSSGESGAFGEISASEMGSLSSVAADNPRLEELNQLRQSLEGLEDEARLHESMLAQASAGIAEREIESARLRRQAEQLAHLAQVVTDTPSTQVHAGDQEAPLNAKDTHQRLNDATRRAFARKRTETADTTITYRGLHVSVEKAHPAQDSSSQDSAFAVLSHPDHPGIEHRIALREAWTRKGQTFRLTAAITQGIDALPRYVKGLHTQIGELAQADDSARQVLAQEFPAARDLEVLQGEVASLEEELVREERHLAELAAKVEALALADVEVLSQEHGVAVGYDTHGQMALDMDVDQIPLLRPPSGWQEQVAPGSGRTERAVQGTHWTLTHHDAPFTAPLPFTAHIRSTLSGQVHAQIDITPQYGPMRGQTSTASQGHFATYGDALLSLRNFFGGRLGPRAEETLSFDLKSELFRRHPRTRAQFAKIPATHQTWWSEDIARLATVTPLTLLDVAAQEGHPALPKRERWWPDAQHATSTQIKDFNGRFALVRTHTGRIQALDLTVDYAEAVRLPGGERLAREWIAEILDLQTALDPTAPRRFLAEGQEPQLAASMFWRAAAHGGDAKDPGTISLRRSVRSAAGLNAVGHNVECTLDRRLVGEVDAADNVQNLTIAARLVEVDDTHLVLQLPFAIPHQSLHEPPVNDGDPLERLRSTAGQQLVVPEGKSKATNNARYKIRVPMSAVASMKANGDTWTNADVQQALQRAEERRQRAAEAKTEPAPAQIESLAPQEMARWVRQLREDTPGLSDQGRAHLAQAEQNLTSGQEADLAAAHTTLALGLEDTVDLAVESTGLMRVVEQVADTLTAQQEHAAAVRLRERFSHQAHDLEAWREPTAAIAHQWAATAQDGLAPEPAAVLLATPPTEWGQAKEDFAHALETLRGCLVQGHYSHAHHLREAIREAYPGRLSQDWNWKGLQQHYDSATITAAHLHTLPAGDERPRELPFPYGLGGLAGHDVVVLASDGQAYPVRVHAVNARLALAADDGRTWATHQIRQVRTSDNRRMILAEGEPAEMEQALAELGQLWRTERDAFLEPFHQALDPLTGSPVQVYGSRALIAEGVLDTLTSTGVNLRGADGTLAMVSYEDIGSVDSPERARWWVDPAADAIEQHLDTSRRLLAVSAHPLARRYVNQASALIHQIEVAPSVRTRWQDLYAELVGRAFVPTRDGQVQVQIERSGPQERTVRVYGAAGASSQVRAIIDGAMNAAPPLTWSEEEQAHVGDPSWRQGMIQARLDQLREDLHDAGIAHSSVTVAHPEPDLTDPEVVEKALAKGGAEPDLTATTEAVRAPATATEADHVPAVTEPHPLSTPPTPDSAVRDPEHRDAATPAAAAPKPEGEIEVPPVEPPTSELEPGQLRKHPELLTLEFHGANQAIKEALKRGDLAMAQEIHEFRVDPRLGGVPGAVQQPGYEVFAELGRAIRNVRIVDDAVEGVIYRARNADLKHGNRAESLRLLTLAEEISPEHGEHMAELRRIRSQLEASGSAGQKIAQEPQAPASGETTDPTPAPAQPDDHQRHPEDPSFHEAPQAPATTTPEPGHRPGEDAQEGPPEDLSLQQQRLLHGAQEQGFLTIGTIGAEELAAGTAPDTPAPNAEPDLPATPEAVRTPVTTETGPAPAPPATEEAKQEPKTAPAAGEPEGLFAVEPQAPTAEDVQRALDNVAAIPNPVRIFNADQTSLVARARRAQDSGDTAAAAAALTHPRMSHGKAARALQRAVGHLARFAPQEADTSKYAATMRAPDPKPEQPSQEPVLANTPHDQPSERTPQQAETETAAPGPPVLATSKKETPAPHNSSSPGTDPFERAGEAIQQIGSAVPRTKALHASWDDLDQALADLQAQGRHQEVVDTVVRIRGQNHYDWWRWEPYRSRAVAALDPAVLDHAVVLHHTRTSTGKGQTHLYGVPKKDQRLQRTLKPLNFNHKVSEDRWQINPSWGYDKHSERVRELIQTLEQQFRPYLDHEVYAELLSQRAEALKRAVVYDLTFQQMHLPTGAPDAWRQAITAHGMSFEAPQAPRAAAFDEATFKAAMQGLRQDLATLQDPPLFVTPEKLYKGVRAALGDERHDELKTQLRHVEQASVDARINALLKEGDVRSAFEAMLEHTTALRGAGIIADQVVDRYLPDGWADFYPKVIDASSNNTVALLHTIQNRKTWSEQDVADLAQDLHRQCPHLSEEQVQAALPVPDSPPPNQAAPEAKEIREAGTTTTDNPQSQSPQADPLPSENSAPSPIEDPDSPQVETEQPGTDQEPEGRAPAFLELDNTPTTTPALEPTTGIAPTPVSQEDTPMANLPDSDDDQPSLFADATPETAADTTDDAAEPETGSIDDSVHQDTPEGSALAGEPAPQPGEQGNGIGGVEDADREAYLEALADQEQVTADDPAQQPEPIAAPEGPPSVEEAPQPGPETSSAETPPTQQPAPGTDPEEDTEANRARAARGNGPLRRDGQRPHLNIDMTGQEEQADSKGRRRSLHMQIPGEHPGAGATPGAQEEGAGQRSSPQEEGQPAPPPTQGPKGTLIDGHRIRAADKRWQHLLESKGGRSAARAKVDPDVYSQMRKQFKKALDNDTDVHLVMPSNDLDQVRQFISMAREYGYEITLSARVPPAPVRVLDTVEQLNTQLHNGHPERAISGAEGRQEYMNLRQILSTVHQEHLVDRVELYPREGITTDPTTVMRDQLIADQDNPRWTLGTPMDEQINKLEKAELTQKEDQRLRTRVPEIARGLVADHLVQDHLKWAHEEVKWGVNYLARTNAERQPFKDTANRATFTTNEHEAHEAGVGHAPPGPAHGQASHPRQEHTDAGAPPHGREPAMAGSAPTRQEAFEVARTPQNSHAQRPPASPQPPAGAPGHQPGTGSQPQHSTRLG